MEMQGNWCTRRFWRVVQLYSQFAPTPPPQHAHTAFAPPQFSAAGAPSGGWNTANLIAALNQMAVQDSPSWVMDSGATSHMSSNDGILLSRCHSPPCSITVGNGQSIPSSDHGTSLLPIVDRYFHLNNVLVAPQLARNLLYVRQLTRDNNCSIEFDASGFLLKISKPKWSSFGAIATGISTPFHIVCRLAAMLLSLLQSCGMLASVIQHQPSFKP
jgi:hypothetical protein